LLGVGEWGRKQEGGGEGEREFQRVSGPFFCLLQSRMRSSLCASRLGVGR
jgi:hypothetical protein